MLSLQSCWHAWLTTLGLASCQTNRSSIFPLLKDWIVPCCLCLDLNNGGKPGHSHSCTPSPFQQTLPFQLTRATPTLFEPTPSCIMVCYCVYCFYMSILCYMCLLYSHVSLLLVLTVFKYVSALSTYCIQMCLCF